MSVRKHRKIGGRYHWSNCLLFDYEFLLRWMTAGYSSLTMERKLYAACAECKARMKKSEMVALLARSKRGEQPKQFGFMCRDCFRGFCMTLGLDVPQLAELTQSVTIGVEDDEKDGESME